jgi:replicative superfamily II helicase
MDQFLRNKDGFKFILSTPEIVYGTNIDLSIIDINSSFIADSTRNTLYQLIGRAGRKGKSHSATIIIRDDEMLNLIFGKIIKNIEAENIEHNYAKILERRP